ncbi:MAG: respiratory nitrate reductase subunit gamma [Pseudomonadota bacterium]
MQALGLLLFCILPYAALALCLGGCAWRLWRGVATPLPWRAPLTPAPSGLAGVAGRLAWQALALPALWRGRPAGTGRLAWWLLVWLLHACLFLTFVHHLRLVVQPVPAWLMALHTPGRLAGHLLPLLLLLLLMRRLAQPVLRRLSRWEDYLAPGLLLGISLSGLAMDSLARPSLVQIKALTLGLAYLSPGPPPPPGLFWLHFLLGMVLLLYAPWGKLLHGAGLLASPGLTQADSPRARLWANPWDAQARGAELAEDEAAPGQPPWWVPTSYRAWLKRRWAGAGVHQVMGARQRAASLTGQRDWPGPGAEDDL